MPEVPKTGLRIAIYARVSTEEQREGQTIDSQVAELERFCREKVWLITGIYKDEGWSGGVCSPGSAPVAPGCVVLFKNSSGNLTEHPGHPCPPETEACGYPPPAGEPAGVGFTSSINGYGENGDAVTG